MKQPISTTGTSRLSALTCNQESDMTPEAYYSVRLGEIMRMLHKGEISFEQAQEEMDYAGLATDELQ